VGIIDGLFHEFSMIVYENTGVFCFLPFTVSTFVVLIIVTVLLTIIHAAFLPLTTNFHVPFLPSSLDLLESSLSSIRVQICIFHFPYTESIAIAAFAINAGLVNHKLGKISRPRYSQAATVCLVLVEMRVLETSVPYCIGLLSVATNSSVEPKSNFSVTVFFHGQDTDITGFVLVHKILILTSVLLNVIVIIFTISSFTDTVNFGILFE
jgi:hypothetical protein